ncbi:MAG: hypothetical protein AAF611_23335 [Bacteroidota bacterium]
MITLKDYIGKIYKDVTNAKVQSDIETLAIAQEYVGNSMLKHFAVPNIRIKDVELTIPVAVDKTQTVTRDYTEREIQQVYEQAFTEVNNKLIGDLSEDKQAFLVSIQPELSGKAQQEAAQTIYEFQQLSSASDVSVKPESEAAVRNVSAQEASGDYALTLSKVANRFADTSFGFVSELYNDEAVFRGAMVQEIERNLQPRTPEIEDLPVIVETQRLKEINDPSSLISVKVTIVDDAMEWTTDVDDDGNTVQRLDYL